MVEVPSLVSLCLDVLKKEIIQGDGVLPPVYLLPSELLHALIMCLPPFGLWKLQNEMPLDGQQSEGYSIDHSTNKRKRGRDGNIDNAWQVFFKLRWPDLAEQTQPTDWQQAYWETHLQNCLDEAAEMALVPSFKGYIGDVLIPEIILKHVGILGHPDHSTFDHAKLSYHCQQFGHYARYLRLQNVLCTAETSNLLRECKLQQVTLRCIRSKDQIDGLCKLLTRHSKTLSSLEFVHCSLSSDSVNAICGALALNGVQRHGLQHFSINSSSFRESGTISLPSGLVSFLSSARSLCSLKFSDNNLGRNFARALFLTLLNLSSSISILDLSDNNIAGWLSDFKRRPLSDSYPSFGTGKSLQLLRVLNLRGNNLRKDDIESLRCALTQMPNLEDLDLSDNPIEDEGVMSLIPFFDKAYESRSSLADLKLENCELSCDGVSHLLPAISTFEGRLKSLSVADNFLGSEVAGALAKYISTCVKALNVGGIGLGPSGFQKLRDLMKGELELVKINISKNRGGIETAMFLTKLLSHAPQLTKVNAAMNLMPTECLTIICAALRLARGNLEHLDLSGHIWKYEPDHASLHAEFVRNGKHILILPSSSALVAPYDDDP
ncbi:protein NLRC3 isoform X2 [Neltuma alba]|uniref:protein NLRC3 isoform X2 n=1 Tax=Neltuma alba TaxID=207710 RepID=UPI0010A2D6EA|nr:protein NLRC3 isoform X2 [Prosopis alba]